MKRIIDWAKTHPRLIAWLVLAVFMNAILIYEARDVGLQAGQWIALVVATTLVAGLCVWIIGWEDDTPEESAEGSGPAAAKPAQTEKTANTEKTSKPSA